ncbi:MAG: molecular chaperone HscC [Lachnospiraceae bacterium]|nr:molecular chaperone HscC [Lachnospiraceae bacterium]
MAIIGIDLGTTNSLVSVWRDGKIQLIPNSFGELLTPSVVGFDETGEVFVGKIAREMLITEPSTTFSEFKRNMGTDYQYTANKRSYRAEELSAFVLRRLKEDAERFLGETVTEAVISVPAYFNDDKRCATKNAGKLAGLAVERLINEPSAVALKHHMKSEEMENFIVFDFGGGTLDVSLVEAFDNMVEIKAVAGDNHLGGKDFDEIIVEDFCQKNGIDRFMLSGKERGILKKEAEQLKRDLTEKNEADRTARIGETEYVMHMTNQELIHISANLFRRMTQPLKKVMNDSDMDWDEIDKVILVGGSSKMPVVKQYIKSLTDVPVVVDDSPDESVAVGAGLSAAIKERKGEIKDMILADICPFSLGTALYDGTFSPIIERNDTLPCSRTRYYVTVDNYQTKMNFPIYQGENLIASENLCLGTVTIKDLPRRPKGESGANVTFMYDINGILDIRIVSDNRSVHKVIVNKKMGLTDAEIEKRLEELQKMTLHPIEQEENRLLIEKAQRMFQESNALTRQYIAEMLRHFKQTLEHGKGREIREEYVRFAMYLEAIDQNRFDFDDFTENFWNEDDGDDVSEDR